jgi:hypothetical protein
VFRQMIKAAIRILERRPTRASTRLMLTEGDQVGEEMQDERADA